MWHSWFGAILQAVTTFTQLLASCQAPGIDRLTFRTSPGRAWRRHLHDSRYTCGSFPSTELLTLKCISGVFGDPGLYYTQSNSFIYLIRLATKTQVYKAVRDPWYI